MSVDTQIDNFQTVTVHPTTAVTADARTTGLDVSGYKGLAKFIAIIRANSGTSPTCDISLEDSADDTTYAALSPAVAFTQATDSDVTLELEVDIDPLRQYIEFVIDVGGTSPNYDVTIVMIARSEAN